MPSMIFQYPDGTERKGRRAQPLPGAELPLQERRPLLRDQPSVLDRGALHRPQRAPRGRLQLRRQGTERDEC